MTLPAREPDASSPVPPDGTGATVEQRHAELGAALVSGIAVFALAAWAFSSLLEEVLDGATLVRWDTGVSAWMHAHATSGGLLAFRVITQLGQGGVWLTIALVGWWLWRRRERLLLGTWLAGNAGGALVEQALKHAVHRPRPTYGAEYLHFHSYSFPSGHTMAAAVCYVLLAKIVADQRGWRAGRRGGAFAVAALLVLLVAVSRIYLGVHYPSDVAGGAIAGVAWVAACAVALRVVRHRAVVRQAARRQATDAGAVGDGVGDVAR